MKKPPPPVRFPESPRTIVTRASAAGTERFAQRWPQLAPDFFRTSRTGLKVSSVALGTYLGESDDDVDAQYGESMHEALSSGINTIDTAINYRCQRSERIIGRVLQDMIESGAIRRDEIVLCTKAGYVPLDGTPPASREAYEEYLRREYFDTGILQPSDLVAGGHALAPDFLRDQLQRSMRNLGVQGIDIFYIHNPEQQLTVVTTDALRSRLRLAFEALEGCVSSGKIGVYGCATWSALRLPAGSHGHLSLYELEALAREVAGDAHHFRAVQLPVNLSMSEAVRISTQRDPRGRLVHVVDAAADLGIDLVVSAPLLQGQLTHDLPPQVREVFAGTTDADRALAFARSLPAVLTVAVGMKTATHVRDNLRPMLVA
ncbi:MAG TPA: aldo/keto reductase [Gemmatimonadaceae bacterium]|nr:aldo/keto reductase [Gemmatimonadaceae bacterium]